MRLHGRVLANWRGLLDLYNHRLELAFLGLGLAKSFDHKLLFLLQLLRLVVAVVSLVFLFSNTLEIHSVIHVEHMVLGHIAEAFRSIPVLSHLGHNFLLVGRDLAPDLLNALSHDKLLRLGRVLRILSSH